MMVVAASGVESTVAGRTAGVALEVLRDAEFVAAGSAEDDRLVPFRLPPDLDGMAGEGDVAILAGVVEVPVDRIEAWLAAGGVTRER